VRIVWVSFQDTALAIPRNRMTSTAWLRISTPMPREWVVGMPDKDVRADPEEDLEGQRRPEL
jgi:hypothetical protein